MAKFQTTVNTTGVTADSVHETEEGSIIVSATGPGEPAESDSLVDGLVIHPFTGSVIDTDDIDSLLNACDVVAQDVADLKQFHNELREIAWSKTSGTNKTRHLVGKTHKGSVTRADVYPDNSILVQAWQTYPQYRDRALKLSSVRPKMREYNKLKQTETDDPAFATFINMINAAFDGREPGTPRVHGVKEIEKPAGQ